MKLPESQNARDTRVEQLWKQLDTRQKGEIDLQELQRGLQKIDHPLKDASDLLKDVVKAMDKNGDKVIQYEEFRVFVEKTETELLVLFESIDKDRNGRLDKEELKAAFARAGLSVSRSKLDQFFTEIDMNNDVGVQRLKNFLLFLPTNASTPALKAVLSYYQSTVSVNAEGDTSIREDTLEGLGTASNFLKVLFGAIFSITRSQSSRSFPVSIEEADTSIASTNDTTNMQGFNHAHFVGEELKDDSDVNDQSEEFFKNASEGNNDSHQQGLTEEKVQTEAAPVGRMRLTEILPDPGYFAAGAIAGAFSRTATAPLDRLKVYLIANISSNNAPLQAAKQGNAIAATKMVGQPLIAACKELWRAGGIRSLFAGNGLNVVKVMPESAIRFGSYEAAKRALAQLEGHGDPHAINPYSRFAAGGVAGIMSQMQCETVKGGLHGNALIAATAKKMYAQGGFRSAYRGLTMGLIGMFPYSAIDLATFETLKGILTRRNARRLGCEEEDALPGPFATGCIGAFSGAFGASVVYPLNVLRTRLQAQGTVLHPPTYTGIVDVTRKTIRNEGVRGLFKGITPNLLKVVPAISITYVVYESAKKTLHLK
ncbi:calcium dependent mitochondrial carrier protein [Rutstroemia sp. NJR-2017a BVV2]|nr:calcium dependent mitochondrial carrier protein [Rutstroemia sp. NJR-2017a BVV2]